MIINFKHLSSLVIVCKSGLIWLGQTDKGKMLEGAIRDFNQADKKKSNEPVFYFCGARLEYNGYFTVQIIWVKNELENN